MTVLNQNDEFPLQAAQLVAPDGLYYVSVSDPSLPANAIDSFALTLRDSDGLAGECLNPGGGATCTVQVTTTPRTDGPMGPASISVNLTSLLDPSRARQSNAANPLDADDFANQSVSERIPWGDVELTEAALGFTDGSTPPDTLTYSLASYADSSRGFLKSGTDPVDLTAASASRRINPGDSFTLPIYYANREIPDSSGTIAEHVLTIDVTDGTVTRQVVVRINPAIDVNTDIGWLIDATFERSVAASLPNACNAIGTNTPRGCRDCHANAACVGSTALWKSEGATAPGGDLLCDNLSARFTSGVLPNRPTQAVHTGGEIFPAGSIPHDLLTAWNGVCP